LKPHPFLIIGLLIAAGSFHAASLIQVSERLLTVDAATDRDPAASGTRTVFVTDRGGTRDVFMIDNDTLSIVVSGPGNQDDPEIDGDRVVYVDDSLGNLDVGLADLTTGTHRFLTVDAARDAEPAISGNIVVFASRRGGTSDVLGYNLVTEQLFLVATGPSDEGGPTIDGDLVAWHVFQNGSFDIMARRLGSPAFVVAGTDADEVAASVSGNRIAYLTDGDVAVYDGNTQMTTRVTNDAFDQSAVVIHGNLITWTDERNGNRDVFLHDLTDASTYQLTDDPLDQTLGDLDGNRIVFSDRRLGDFNVWQLLLEITHDRKPGDIDADGDVDLNDLNALLRDRNKTVADSSCGVACDLDGDGMITVLDGRKLMLLCTRSRCAVE
jgi:beta propeller repeat protein